MLSHDSAKGIITPMIQARRNESSSRENEADALQLALDIIDGLKNAELTSGSLKELNDENTGLNTIIGERNTTITNLSTQLGQKTQEVIDVTKSFQDQIEALNIDWTEQLRVANEEIERLSKLIPQEAQPS